MSTRYIRTYDDEDVVGLCDIAMTRILEALIKDNLLSRENAQRWNTMHFPMLVHSRTSGKLKRLFQRITGQPLETNTASIVIMEGTNDPGPAESDESND